MSYLYVQDTKRERQRERALVATPLSPPLYCLFIKMSACMRRRRRDICTSLFVLVLLYLALHPSSALLTLLVSNEAREVGLTPPHI